MAADTLTRPILDYVSTGAYPDSEQVASATLSSSDLGNLLQSLNEAQDEAKSEIETLSASTAGDIDTWIERAKALQSDIVRSRETARQIVEEAEKSEALKAEVHDKGNKVALLEKEVDFNQSLVGTLEHICHANGLLQKARDEAVHTDIAKAIEKLEDAEASIVALEQIESSRAREVLSSKANELRQELSQTVTELWNALIIVDADGKTLRIERTGVKTKLWGAQEQYVNLEIVVPAANNLDIFDSLLAKLSEDIDKAILKPGLTKNGTLPIARIETRDNEVSCSRKTDDLNTLGFLVDLRNFLAFLYNELPRSVTVPLSRSLIPALTSRLEDQWLDPALPITMSEVAAFPPLLQEVTSTIDLINRCGWHGARGLQDWQANIPRVWLTKRREALLGDVRELVFTGLRETKTVERVETRVIGHDDDMLGGGAQNDGGDDEWDTAWDDNEESSIKGSEKKSVKANDDDDDDDDASAWDLDDDEVDKQDKPSENPPADDDEAAWGWGDGEDDNPAKPPNPTATRSQPAPTSRPEADPQTTDDRQELTLRETFTVTQIPETLHRTLHVLIFDAQYMAQEPDLASSPIGQATPAVYTLPTLALAMYRATAPTAYASLPTGSMLIYNDASYLASQLRAWQADEEPEESRLRVEKDAEALETFAKKNYGSEMERQRMVIRDLLDGAQGFSNCTSLPFKAECWGAVEQTVDRLRDVYKLWKDILSHGALMQSLGSLLSTATTKIISEVQDLPDISEPESQELKKLLTHITTLKDIFTKAPDSGAGPAGEEGQDLTFVYSPTWLKFQYLSEILDSSLADIKWMWKDGELSLEFEAEEVVELIEALFAESDLRRRAIGEIRNGRR